MRGAEKAASEPYFRTVNSMQRLRNEADGLYQESTQKNIA